MSNLNFITRLLCYNDAFTTDNPNLRVVDWTRQVSNIAVCNPKSDSYSIPAMGSLTVFNGSRTLGLTPTSSLITLSYLSPSNSIYKLSCTDPAFGTPYATSGVTGCNVTINNNSVASFDFGSADLTAVPVGAYMRINGAANYDTAPYAFSSLNAGYWVIIAITGSVLQCIRPSGQNFVATAENPSSVASDVQFFAQPTSSTVNPDDTFAISGTLSLASFGNYAVLEATPYFITFVSAQPLPTQSSVPYVASTFNVYSSAKNYVYLECDQNAAVQANADTSSNSVVNPIAVGDPSQPGVYFKIGKTYSLVIKNLSLTTLNVKAFFAE